MFMFMIMCKAYHIFAMFVQLISLLHFILLLLLPPAFSDSISKHGCPERCGNLLIAYPFGVGSDCSLNPSFNITCDTSVDPPKAFVKTYVGTMLEVVEINVSQIRVKLPYLLNIACYDNSGKLFNSTTGDSWFGIRLTGTQYTFSEENWLTSIGCDDMVLGLGEGNKTFGGGCASFCDRNSNASSIGFCPNNANGYSPGNGCCRTPVPRGINYLGAQFMDISKKWRGRKLFPCSYAFVEEKVVSNESNFSYPLSYLNRSGEYRNYRWGPTSRTPVFRLDWRIGANNCSLAVRNTTCQDNSECVDVDADANIQGYHCRCLQGYEGNPYLFPGCRDINECDNFFNPCAQNSICNNYLGSFSCVCKKGYYGDGNATGFGCKRLPTTSKNSIAIGLGSGIGFLLLLLICFWLRKEFIKRNERNRKEKFYNRNGGLLLQQKTNEGTIRKTKHFPAKELDKATDRYNKNRILGQGGQGTVYKGMLSDGKIVAIKKLNQVDEDQLEQFINEVVILSQVDHRNVVKLLGCCLENEVPLLLYEFVPNGTLFNLIHDRDAQFPISWNMRLKIAADIAGALAYLHFSASVPIYHRDIKSSNILLGEKFVVKVSDFGTSKSVEVDKTHLTTLVKGSFGYFDPEYFQSGQFTSKSDVYSFGVVIVELLTGQKPISSERSEEEKSLAIRFLAAMEENNLETILDPQVMEQGLKEEVIAVARLAQRCLNLKGKMRPTMKEVATELANYSNIAQMSSTVQDKFEEAREYEAKPMMISDIEYTWTTSSKSEISSFSDTHHPFMAEAV